MSWEYIKEVRDPLRNVNVVIATYITATARFKVYDHLEVPGSQVFSYDIESTLYYFRSQLLGIPTRDYLGEMTD